MAAELWGHVQKDFARYYPNVNSTFQQEFNGTLAQFVGNPTENSGLTAESGTMSFSL